MPRPASLSLDLLRTLLALLRHDGDAAETARELGINQPSMSKRLFFLQYPGRVLARPWLRRVGKKWDLTEEGSRIFPAVKEIVQRYDQLQEFVGQPCQPQVVFACGQNSAATFVLKAVSAFRKTNEDLRLRVMTLRGKDRILGVTNGSLDLATVSHDEGDIFDISGRRLFVRPLLSDPLVLVACSESASGRALAGIPGDAPLKPKSLVDLPLILPDQQAGARKAFDRILQENRLLHLLDIVLEVGGSATMLAYVAAGLGVGVVSEAAVRGAGSSRLIVRPLNSRAFPPRQLCLITRRAPGSEPKPDLSPAAWKFHDTLLRVLGAR